MSFTTLTGRIVNADGTTSWDAIAGTQAGTLSLREKGTTMVLATARVPAGTVTTAPPTTTTPTTPTKLTAPAVTLDQTSSTSLTANISAVTGNNGYTIAYATDSGFTQNTGSVSVAKDGTTKLLSGLTPDTLYYTRTTTLGTGTYANSDPSAVVSQRTKVAPVVVSTPLVDGYFTNGNLTKDSTTYYPGTAFAITGSALYNLLGAYEAKIKSRSYFPKLALDYLYAGNAQAGVLNFLDPRPLPAAFALTLSNGATFTGNGLQLAADGSQKANTNYSINQLSDVSGYALAAYLNAQNQDVTVPMGANWIDGGNVERILDFVLLGNTMNLEMPGSGVSGVVNTTGLLIGNRQTTADLQFFARGTKLGSQGDQTNESYYEAAPASAKLFIASRGGNGPFYNLPLQSNSLFKAGLTFSEVADFQADKQELMVGLKRNV